MARVRLSLSLRQAEALAQLAEEASLETFSSCGESEPWADMMCRAGTKAIDALRDSIAQCVQKNTDRKTRPKNN